MLQHTHLISPFPGRIIKYSITNFNLSILLEDGSTFNFDLYPSTLLSMKEVNENFLKLRSITNEYLHIKSRKEDEIIHKIGETLSSNENCSIFSIVQKDYSIDELSHPLLLKRVTDLPLDIVPSYARRIIILPKEISNTTIKFCSKFRMKGRFPIICMLYQRGTTMAPLSRSSQPKVGLTSVTCKQDEFVVEKIRELSTSKAMLIMDCRSKIGALANHIKGGGTMNLKNYPSCGRCYLGMENIHKVQRAHLLQGNGDEEEWVKGKLLLLRGAQRAIDSLSKGEGVLVHCSDGWDRTPQICALIEIFLLPISRSIVGFLTLIQKIFIDGGHPFNKRRKGVEGECPIFLQWIEVIHQIITDRPFCFEFNSILLKHFLREVYNMDSCFISLSLNMDSTNALTYKWEGDLWSEIVNPTFDKSIQEITNYHVDEFKPINLFFKGPF